MTAELLDHKRDRLLHILAEMDRVAVAFSGGVDSTVVAKAAQLACGNAAMAVTAQSPSLADGELEEAKRLAAQIGIRHEVIATQEFDEPGYQRNAGDRCYYCKSELYEQMVAAGFLDGCTLVNGTNTDDLGDYRPGLRAADERRVRSPLVEAGMSKSDVRELARQWELPVWDKPAAPCLSSRIAYGIEVTPERVRRVDAAEAFLKELLGIRELRVRVEANETARIEVPIDHVASLTDKNCRAAIVAKFHELGFRYVTLDLEGFRSGSLNAALPMVAEIALPDAE